MDGMVPQKSPNNSQVQSFDDSNPLARGAFYTDAINHPSTLAFTFTLKKSRSQVPLATTLQDERLLVISLSHLVLPAEAHKRTYLDTLSIET